MPHAVPINVDEDLIVEACANYDALSKFDSLYSRDRVDGVIRYSAITVIKFGGGITAEEARNQRHAHKVLDPLVVHVAEVYHYFERHRGPLRTGYLVMEYIEGEQCVDLPEYDQLHKIAGVIEHLASQYGDAPGPVGGGRADGVLCDDAEGEVKSVAELEKHFNDRLFDSYGGLWDEKRWRGTKVEPLCFQEREIVLVHGEIVPRNILWCPDGRPALLDWAVAGFYPKIFEHTAMECSSTCYERRGRGRQGG